jgi:hypothetical protein
MDPLELERNGFTRRREDAKELVALAKAVVDLCGCEAKYPERLLEDR